MILKYYEGTNPADKTKEIFYIDLNKVAKVSIVQTQIGDLTKYTFMLEGNEISRIFAGNGSCVYYYFDSRDEVEKLIDDIFRCRLTNKVSIYDIDENIRNLYLNCSGRGYVSKGWHWY